MSAGTPKPATWPRCLGPLAYGQATATRIFCGDCVVVHPFEARRRASDHTSRPERRRGRADACDAEQHVEEQRQTTVARIVPDEDAGSSVRLRKYPRRAARGL